MEHEYKPPRKKPAGLAFLLAGLALFLLKSRLALLFA